MDSEHLRMARFANFSGTSVCAICGCGRSFTASAMGAQDSASNGCCISRLRNDRDQFCMRDCCALDRSVARLDFSSSVLESIRTTATSELRKGIRRRCIWPVQMAKRLKNSPQKSPFCGLFCERDLTNKSLCVTRRPSLGNGFSIHPAASRAATSCGHATP